jgi:hypothetical protein
LHYWLKGLVIGHQLQKVGWLSLGLVGDHGSHRDAVDLLKHLDAKLITYLGT